MNSKINLFSKKEIIHKEVRKVIIVTIVIFSIIFLITLGIVLANLFRSMEYNRLQAREDEVRGKINQLAKKRDNILKLHDRLSSIETFLKARKLIDARFASLTDVVPDGIAFSDISITKEKITLQMQTTNLSDYNGVLELLYTLDQDEELKKRLAEIKKIEITSFGANPRSGTYEVEMNFDYAKGS